MGKEQIRPQQIDERVEDAEDQRQAGNGGHHLANGRRTAIGLQNLAPIAAKKARRPPRHSNDENLREQQEGEQSDEQLLAAQAVRRDAGECRAGQGPDDPAGELEASLDHDRCYDRQQRRPWPARDIAGRPRQQ
jgi:hypothetical protein